jgi:hypothetical protein
LDIEDEIAELEQKILAETLKEAGVPEGRYLESTAQEQLVQVGRLG